MNMITLSVWNVNSVETTVLYSLVETSQSPRWPLPHSPTAGDESSLRKEQMEQPKLVLTSSFFNSVKEVNPSNSDYLLDTS